MSPFQPEAQSAVELWCQLQPDETDGSHPETSITSCQLGHFRVEEQIGRGGMGAVYRAVDTRLDRVVALKVLSPTQSHDLGSIERFRNEARSAARMDHDNIARVYYFGEDQGLSFIAFEFVHGGNVKELIERRGLLPPADAVNYALQVAQALRHTDAAGVVHRDIKPSNIIITPAGRAKLVDLGLARKRDPQATNDLTVDGTTLGTFDYISPEQAKDPKKVDVRSDIYSLGCTLFHMLTGEPPYPKGTMLQKLLDHQAKGIPDASERNPRIPPELSAVVRKMMASEPNDRYATPERLIDDLKLMAHRCGLRPVQNEGEIWVRPRRTDGWDLWKNYGSWIVAATFLLIVVFAIDYTQRSDTNVALLPNVDTVESTDEETVVENSSESMADQSSPPASRRIVPGNDEGLAVNHQDPSTNGVDGRPVAPFSNTTSNVVEPESGILSSLITGGPEEAPFGPVPLDSPNEIPLPITSRPGNNLEGDLSDFDINGLQDLPTRVATPSHQEGKGWPVPEDANAGITSPPTVSKDPFIVVVNGVQRGSYPTLEAACTHAPTDASIELAFDGESADVQTPLVVSGKRLFIRQAEGHRPTLRFSAPAEWRLGRQGKTVSMIEVSHGSLEIYNVDIQLDVSADLDIQQWNVIALNDAKELSLRGVSVTVENAETRSVAIVELSEPVGRFDRITPPSVQVNATDCFFRGHSDLILDHNVDPADIRLTNVAVALEGTVIRIEGTDQTTVGTDMNEALAVNLEIKQVTAWLGSGMARFEVNSNHSVPKLTVDADDSVIAISSSVPLIRMQGEFDLHDFEDRLEWSDQATFLHGPSFSAGEPVWQIVTPGRSRNLDRDEFDDRWNRGRGPIRRAFGPLLNAQPGLPFARITREDLELFRDAEQENPAVNGAIDGADAGVKWEAPRLPSFDANESIP
ncbi:MAG: serine/threonine protein kinase [Planctomycetaceae bacterium]|nr:serine/threonine protein kinase [Planctomycetaceae bacterium]